MLDLAQQVEGRRKELRLTQAELADLAGCSLRFIQSVESGKQSLRLDKLTPLLDALGLQLQITKRATK